MSSLFNRKFYDKIGNRVWFNDHFQNEIEVKVRRKNNQVFLTDGWRQIRRVYNLREGGYLKVFVYIQYEFVINTVLHRWMVVRYPETPVHYALGGHHFLP